jgi:hypothetical protein
MGSKIQDTRHYHMHAVDLTGCSSFSAWILIQGRKDLVHCWTILLKQKVESNHFCVEYIEQHLELLDFLVVW